MTKKVLTVLILILAMVLIPSAVALADSGSTPSAPTNLAGTVTDDGIVLTWTDNSSIEIAFLIFRKLSTDVSWSADYYAYTDPNITTYTDTEVSSGKTYEYKVYAFNVGTSGGWIPMPVPVYSDPSNIISVYVPFSFIIIEPIFIFGTAPDAPTNLSLPSGYQAQPDSVSLKWTDNADNEEGFVIERRLSAGPLMIYYFWVEIDEVGENVKTFTDDDEDLVAGKSYEYRVRAFNTNIITEARIYSEYSNVLTVTTAANSYPGASSWAVEEIDLAVQAGLTTPDILSNFQNSITREEFCEIAVKLYEALSGETAYPVSPNPFTDTSNSEILKAYNLGIVKGISATSFAPNQNITRQEICVMLLRALKAVHPGANYSATGVGTFADESLIASWAIDAVRYMNKEGIMQGVGAGRIDPLGNTTREQAILLVYRTYDANI